MKQLIGIAVLLAAGPLAAQEITIDYAKDVDFANVKTFQYSETEDTNIKDPMMGERIVADLKAKLIDGGLSEVEDNPDIFVTYHGEEQEELNLNTTHFGYGYGGGWYWDPYWGGGVGNWSTEDERAGGIDVKRRVDGGRPAAESLRENALAHRGLDRIMLDAVVVLAGHHQGGHPNGLAVPVLHRDL